MNYKGIAYWLAIAFILIMICVVGLASASERIQAGGIVYLNETYDISGATGWSSKIVWAGRWADSFSVDNESIKYQLELPNIRKGYYNFYIDPAIFANRLGWWYQYYGTYEEQGNLRVFYVKETRPKKNETENKAELGILEIKPAQEPAPELPVKVEADYLVARGDHLIFRGNWTTPYSVWIFGRVDGVYDARFSGPVVTIDKSTIESLEPGTYTVLVIEPGQNGQLDTKYSDDRVYWFDSEKFSVDYIDSAGVSPMVLLDKIRDSFPATDDTISQYSLEVQDPYIDIVNRDTIYIDDDTAKMIVRGYTNEAANASVSLTIDKEYNPPQVWHPFTISAKIRNSGNDGAYRYFSANISIALNETRGYQHTIDAVSPLGAHANVDFYVYTAPVGMRAPNKTIRYIGGNEFIPTPTPEIVKEIVTVVPPPEIRMEYVTVTPSDQQVRQADFDNKTVFLIWALEITVVIVFVAYLVSVYIRGRRIRP